jgi:PAS domain S-box-containing protein
MLHMWNIPAEKASHLTASDVMAYAAPLWVNPELEVARVRELISINNLQEDRLQLKDGRVLLRRCIPTQRDGREVRVWGFRDITVESRALAGLRAAEAQQRDLLAAFPGYISCIDADHRYTYVNERLAWLLGSTASQIVGSTVTDLVGQERAPLMARRMARALDGEVLSYERLHPATAEHPDLHLLITLARGVDRASGRYVVYGFGTDITALKQTQAALLMAKEEAERANQAKSVFLSNMSHELRTPMNAVLGFAQLLESDQEPALSMRQRGQVREILQGGRHLLMLINDLLDLARIEADQLPLHPGPVGLRALMTECITFLASLAQRHRIDVVLPEGDEELTVLADPTRLRQVLLNLLGNAIKYNHEGGWVRLTFERDGPWVRTSVVDGGPGISADQQQRLFQRFERLGADGGPVEGAGIGLALSQRLMHLMGGQIGAISQLGEGSQFWFTLPESNPDDTWQAPPLTASTQGASPLRAASGQPVVLYIEDNPVNTLLMQAMFERFDGVQLLCESSPLTGLARALAKPPNLILLDLQMPEMDGYTLLQHLRADPATAHIPVIAVSASATPQDCARGMDAGFADYLTKPLDLQRLQAAVQASLSGA